MHDRTNVAAIIIGWQHRNKQNFALRLNLGGMKFTVAISQLEPIQHQLDALFEQLMRSRAEAI